jgi:hypothetical protein
MGNYDDGPENRYGHETVDELRNVQSALEDVNSNLKKIQSTLTDIGSTLKNKSAYSWVWVLVFFSCITNWPGSRPDRFTDRAWYSLNYNADWQRVDIQRRPSDCDFTHAPIGVKRCSYSKQKTVFDNEERQKLMSQAQTQEQKNVISKMPNTVTIYWAKKDEPMTPCANAAKASRPSVTSHRSDTLCTVI